MNNVLIGIVVAVVVVAGGYFLFMGNTAMAPVEEGDFEAEMASDASQDVDNAIGEDEDVAALKAEVTGEKHPSARGVSGGATSEPVSTRDNVSAEQVAEKATSVTITYTDSGFSPREVTVKKGKSVTWVNDSSRDMWPASAVHPTHGAYPEDVPGQCLGSSFDACTGHANGAVWTFTFNQVGQWRYHDHIDASKTGTVIVTP